jgi:hypothetical protein
MEQWYYAQNGQQHGPHSDSEMRYKIESGQVQGTDLVWRRGMVDWVEARQLRELWPDAVAPVPTRAAAAPPARQRAAQEPPGYYAAPPARLTWEDADTHIQRVISWDMQDIDPEPEERQQLNAAGVTDDTAQRYAVWRRSGLWAAVAATSLAAICALIDVVASASDSKIPGFVSFQLFLIFLAVSTMPVCAFLAARRYTQPDVSHRLLLLGGAVAFGVPLLVCLVPVDWWVGDDGKPWDAFRNHTVLGGMIFFTLMPVVLSLVPAACRACIRLKTLMPSSVLPGWLLFVVGPLGAVMALAAFMWQYQVLGNILLMVGFLALVAAPCLYLIHWKLLIRPLHRNYDMRPLEQVQTYILIAVGAGLGLLILGMFSTSLLVDVLPNGQGVKKSLLGFTQRGSFVPFWSLDLHQFWIEFVGRGLFATVLLSDLILRLNLSIWRQDRALQRTAESGEHDRTMASLHDMMEPPPVEHAAPRQPAQGLVEALR